MSYDPKTIVIDTSEVLAKYQDSGESSSELPRTIPIDSQEIARRQQASAEQQHAPATPSTDRSWSWVLIAGIGAAAILAYLIAA